MVYTYSQYLNYGVVLPLVVALLLLVVAVILAAFLHKRKNHALVVVTPLIVLLCTYILLIVFLYPALPFLEVLPFEKNENEACDIVLVEEVEGSALLPIYYTKEQNSLASAGVIRTNRGVFYCINSDNFLPGDYIKITFLPSSRAVLRHDTATESEAFEYWAVYPDVPDAPLSVGYRETGYEGPIIVAVFFLITVKAAAIGYFATPLSDWLLRYDNRRDGIIKPRVFGILDKVYTELIFLFACIFAWRTKTMIISFFFLLVALGYGCYIAEIFSTRVIFSENEVCLRSFTSTFEFKKQDIAMIRWEYPRRSSMEVLAIYTYGKTIIKLPLNDFAGLRNFVEWWDNHATDPLENTHDSTRTKSSINGINKHYHRS